MTQEVRKFDAEVDKILHLMIHSLYTNKDIFLRELISNASDACDKIKFESLSKPDLLGSDQLKIIVSINRDNKTISIRDNGIGMSRQDLIDNIGTIARSGTQKFMQQLDDKNAKDISLIGQFGVGFYSVFMVADEVSVISKKAGSDEANVWFSKGHDQFSLDIYDQEFSRGTEIIIKLKDSAEEYLDKFRLEHIISTYSDHILVPIELYDNETGKYRTINSSSALWMRPKNEITPEEYQEFYKKIGLSADKPWLTIHNKNEGTLEYTNLLFIPSARTFDLFHPDRKHRVKLYIKRVFINDEGIDIIPAYMRFVRGVVDSEDLPLNISRETLQHNKTLEKIKHSITKKIISELQKKLKNDRQSYIDFWNNFGAVIKEGLCEGFNTAENLIDICLFKSAKTGDLISLEEYLSSMKEGQESIYYISGEDPAKLRSHPQIEGFLSRDIDVLMFTDTVDDFWVNVLSQYKEKEIKSVTRSDINLEKLNKTNQENKELEKDQNDENLVDYIKKVLNGLVLDVKSSDKLTSTPVCLAVKDGAMDIRMERYLIEQKQIKSSSIKILEINLKHVILQKLKEKVENNLTDQYTDNIVKMLFDQACIIENEPVNDASAFAQRFSMGIEKLMEKL
jgi:molecular chaperone HtpG